MPDAEVPTNSFLSTLQRHRGGAVLHEASQKLAELTAAVHATGKAGTLTLTFALKPASRGVNAVVLKDRVACKVPSIEAEESFWFADSSGSLLKEDPRQKQLGFQPQAIPGGVAATAVQEAKVVNG